MFSLDQLMIHISALGHPAIMTLLSLIIINFLIVQKKKHHLYQFSFFMISGALSVTVIKNILQEPRPVGGLVEAYGYGFPSGHTTMATLFFLLILFAFKSHIKNDVLRYTYIIFCILMIGLISYSRIYLGVHSWVDVIGGYFLGIFWFLLSLLFYSHLQNTSPRKTRGK